MGKSKKERIAEKLYVQTEAMARAFQRMIELHNPTNRWRFTFNVSLSAEPVAEVHEKKEVIVK